MYNIIRISNNSNGSSYGMIKLRENIIDVGGTFVPAEGSGKNEEWWSSTSSL